MRPGIFPLTRTSLASTVPINLSSLGGRAVSRYQISDPTVSRPRIMKTLFRAFIVPPEQQRIMLQFRHRRVSEHARGYSGSHLSILEDCLAKKFNQGLSSRSEYIGREGFNRHNQAPNRRTEKIKDICAQSGERDLKPVHVDQFSRGDAFAHRGLKHGLDGCKDALNKDRQSARFAFVEAHHFLLHQALKLLLRENAIEVIKSGSQEPFAGGCGGEK